MKYYDSRHIDSAIKKIEETIEKMKVDAAWSGSMTDGGASHLQNKLDIFTTMWDKTNLAEFRIPRFIKPYIEAAEREEDPEYQNFLRLKSKFEK